MKTAHLDALARSMTGLFAFCGIGVRRAEDRHIALSTAPGIHADTDTMFRAASISKLVVGRAVSAFVETKATTWQTDVSDILGWSLRNPAFPDVTITLAMVASHSAGLTDDGGYLIPADCSLQEWCLLQPVHATMPGSSFSYCNLGYIILAAVLERLATQPFPDIIRPFLPVNAGFNWVDVPIENKANHLPTYRRGSDGFIAQIDDVLQEPAQGLNAGIYSPQGGLRISMNGLMELAFDLRTAQATPLWTPASGPGDYLGGVFESYGSGLQIFDTPAFYPRRLIGHFGNAYGFKGGVWYDAAAELSFAYVLNGSPVGDDNDDFSVEELQIFQAVAAL